MSTDRETAAARESSGQQASQIEKGAQGQFVGTQHGGESDGVASAKPTVVTGSEDATAHKWSPDRKDPPDDWDANFDLRDPDKS